MRTQNTGLVSARGDVIARLAIFIRDGGGRGRGRGVLELGPPFARHEVLHGFCLLCRREARVGHDGENLSPRRELVSDALHPERDRGARGSEGHAPPLLGGRVLVHRGRGGRGDLSALGRPS